MSPSWKAWASPDRTLRATADVRVGTFRCPAGHPEFRTAGQIEGYTVVFPRSAVWIEHQDRRPFVADAGIATIYNRGQRYTRRAISPEGDRSDWVSVSRALATEIVTGIDPWSPGGEEGPFPVARAPASAELYYRQRVLFGRVRDGAIDDFELEQEVVLLVGGVLDAALRTTVGAPPREGGLRALVEGARELIASDPLRAWTVRELAGRLETSPYHLCRAFRRVTGFTLHNYQLELRVRAALERLDRPGRDLSGLAAELGFAGHSHFTKVFRERLGRTPSRVRAELCSVRALSGSG